MCVNLLNNIMICEKGCQEFGSSESLYKHTHTHTHNSIYYKIIGCKPVIKIVSRNFYCGSMLRALFFRDINH